MNNPILHKEFQEGTVPNLPDGFYTGSIEQIYPETAGESVLALLSSVWSPWRGKYFYRNGKGDNVLSNALMWVVKIRFGDLLTTQSTDGKFHAFPFEYAISPSLFEDRAVLQLKYDLPQNPELIRGVVDEIVWTATGDYLGTCHLRGDTGYRLACYFRLNAQD